MVAVTQTSSEMETRRLCIEEFYHRGSVLTTLKVGQDEVTSRRTIFPFRKKKKFSTASKHTHHTLKKEEKENC